MKNTPIYLLNAEECFTLNERLLNIFKTDFADELFVNEVKPQLVELNTYLSIILANINGSEMTEQLAEKDKARNAAFISFRDYCKAFVNEPDPVQSKAGQKLTDLIRKVGWTLYNQGYTEQTAAQNALVEALAEPEYADAIAQINAGARLKAMQATNEAFEVAVTHKIEFLSREKVPTITECKRSLNKYLKPLLDYLELMSELKPEIYRASTTKIAEEIEYVLTAAKARQTRKENQQAEDEIIDAA